MSSSYPMITAATETTSPVCWPPWKDGSQLPLCHPTEFSRGNWVRINESTYENRIDYLKHYLFHGPGEAAYWQQLWIPQHCAYHRFTTESLLHFSKKMLHSSHSNPHSDQMIHLAVVGDSGTRGIVCGIIHIARGSEVFGPSGGNICGNRTMKPNMGKAETIITEQLNPHLKFTFIYSLAGFVSPITIAVTGELIRVHQPDIIFYNNGVGHFVGYHNNGLHHYDDATCDTEGEEHLADSLVEINKKPMLHLAELANSLNVRLVYRNIHFNAFYGALCFDPLLENWILENQRINPNNTWELFDTRRISHHIWREQLYDGFHYSREHNMWTVEEHQQAYHGLKSRIDWGKLEMQFAQSMLHFVFYEQIKEELEEHKVGLSFHNHQSSYTPECNQTTTTMANNAESNKRRRLRTVH